jgi:hypothetical protein
VGFKGYQMLCSVSDARRKVWDVVNQYPERTWWLPAVPKRLLKTIAILGKPFCIGEVLKRSLRAERLFPNS